MKCSLIKDLLTACEAPDRIAQIFEELSREDFHSFLNAVFSSEDFAATILPLTQEQLQVWKLLEIEDILLEHRFDDDSTGNTQMKIA